MHLFLRQRHLVLLVVLLAMLILQPMSHGWLYGLLIFDFLLGIMTVAVLTIVFERKREQTLALIIALPMMGGNIVLHALSHQVAVGALVAWHGLLVVYLGFAMVVILRNIFRRDRVSTDELIGVLCGYIISGVAWANLYLVVALLIPDAFTIDEQIAKLLETQTGRRFTFNDYSFVTLTSLGTSNITPIHPLATSLTWLEAMYGQFYLAIVVAQLVGMRQAKHKQPATAA